MSDLSEKVRMFLASRAKAWVYQHERGEEGRDHLQVMLITFTTQCRAVARHCCARLIISTGVRAVSEPADFRPSPGCLECY